MKHQLALLPLLVIGALAHASENENNNVQAVQSSAELQQVNVHV